MSSNYDALENRIATLERHRDTIERVVSAGEEWAEEVEAELRSKIAISRARHDASYDIASHTCLNVVLPKLLRALRAEIEATK